MNLVATDHYHRGVAVPRLAIVKEHHPYEEWVKMRHKIRKAEMRRKTRTKSISDFLRRVMPEGRCPPPPILSLS